MISWAELECRARGPQRKRQLGEYAKMEIGISKLTNLLAEIFGSDGGRPMKSEPRIEPPLPEVQIDTPKPEYTR